MKGRADLLLVLSLMAGLFALFGTAPYARAGGGAAASAGAPFDDANEAPLALRPPGAELDDGGPSPVVFPQQSLPLRFDHQKHVKGLGQACPTCHERAESSRRARDSLLPPATRCDGCHGTNHADAAQVSVVRPSPLAECGSCHVGYDPMRPQVVQRVRIPPPNLRFDHARHTTDLKMPCAECHGRVEELKLSTRDQLPRMKACLSCHDGRPGEKRASGACATCHLTEPSGRLKTHFSSGALLPPPWLNDSGHGPDWIERHKRVAGDDSASCGTCHAPQMCVSCHDGTVRPRRIHPNDWLNQHAMAARQNSPRCTSCHQQQSFCLGCHQRSGVTQSGPALNFANRGRFHPPSSVWVGSSQSARGAGHHAWEAQRNLNACVSCHQERDCTLCHATRAVGGRGAGPTFGQGRGVNPHPRGFERRCRQALSQNPRPCLVCHGPRDPDLERCR